MLKMSFTTTQIEGIGGRLYCGDCLEVLKGFDNNSVDAIVTDPP